MILNSKENRSLNTRFKLAIVVNAIFTLIEFVAGHYSGSLALISDASHNLTDVFSLIISFITQKVAQKKPNCKKTFGYGRITILAALVNILILTALAIYILIEVYHRLYNQEEISGSLVVITSAVGILINGGAALMFLKYRSDLNIKSAMLNMAFDALASAGAMVSGIIITCTNFTAIDLIISIAICITLIFSIYNLSYKVINILLEGVPDNIDLNILKKNIESINFVKKSDHIHVWAISSFNIFLSCNIIVNKEDLSNSPNIVQEIKKMLKHKFNITHATIEVDTETNNKICYKNSCFILGEI